MTRMIFFILHLSGNWLFCQGEIRNLALVDPSFPVAYRGHLNQFVLKGYEQDTLIVWVAGSDTLGQSGYLVYPQGGLQIKDTIKV